MDAIRRTGCYCFGKFGRKRSRSITNMNVTEKLRLELLVREQLQKHGDDFYEELAKILEKIKNEDTSNDTGRRVAVGLRHRLL